MPCLYIIIHPCENEDGVDNEMSQKQKHDKHITVIDSKHYLLN